MGDSKITGIFIAYSRKDVDFLTELKTFLFPLERNQSIRIWYDGEIVPGEVWENEIKQALHAADIVLLLVSANSLASDYFYNKEVSNAMERHRQGDSIVIPVILKPSGWKETDLASLQALPQNGKPITLWENRDEAYASIYEGLKTAIRKIQDRKRSTDHQDQEKPAGDKLAAENLFAEHRDEQKTVSPVVNPATTDFHQTPGQQKSNTRFKKWMIPAAVLLVIVITAGIYLMNKGNKKVDGTSVILDTSNKGDNSPIAVPKDSSAARSKENPSNLSADTSGHNAGTGPGDQKPVIKLKTFAEAFEYVFKDARNNFQNVRGDLVNKDLKNYATRISITDGPVQASNIFFRGHDWVFRFITGGPKDREPIFFSEYDNIIQSTLKKYHIEFQKHIMPFGSAKITIPSFEYKGTGGLAVEFTRMVSATRFNYEIMIHHTAGVQIPSISLSH